MSSVNTPGPMSEANRLAMLNHPANRLNSSQESEPAENTTPTGDEKELDPSDFMSVYQPGAAISKSVVSHDMDVSLFQLANKIDAKRGVVIAVPKKTFYEGGI